MLDFTNLPKQWIICPEPLEMPVSGKLDNFGGRYLALSETTPIQRLIDAKGQEVGRLIGWVIHDGSVLGKDGEIRLSPEASAETLFKRLGGRFVMLWHKQDGTLCLREDSAGSLPAIVMPETGIVGSTVTVIDQLIPLEVNADVEGIFSFPAGPKNYGYLPFGLTPRKRTRRLLPNHAVHMGTMEIARIWPDAAFTTRPTLSDADIATRVVEVTEMLRSNVQAVLKQGMTVLYLSGGHDSRIVLGAARGMTDRLRAETLGDAGVQDTHIAARVARIAGVQHSIVNVLPVTDEEVAAWLHRSGRMVYAPVSQLGPTARSIFTGHFPISGTGAEIVRASNWAEHDLDAEKLEVTRLLGSIAVPYFPDVPVLREAAQRWLDGLPNVDTPMALDLAKIEQIHGCWSGPESYGHPLPFPTIHPFSGQRFNEIALSMPPRYRLEKRMFEDVLGALWPDLLSIPVNRAQGLSRLRFWQKEVGRMMTPDMRRKIRSLRYILKGRTAD